ncbi:uncharacterized protein KIAA1614 homolog isoform X2 [Gopherus evgoodei]|uniref:uncharacterized protein KIAA1614 homolog isoform X2 n=1 Tax=Gopherus evgoodei TaxID=1825980 RepID=UPI0011CF2025|nr:uncharacterized protein KIAA1614 homolog isoform X2 [Gopherus evgoodei]
MEGNSSIEKRRAMKGSKQHGKKANRSNLPTESAEPSIDQPVQVALEPAGLRGEPGRATHSILEGKVKALKEKRLTVKQGGAVSQEWASLKKPKARKGKLAPGLAVVEGVPQDTVVEPRAQIRTYLTDVLLDSHDDVDFGQGARGPVAADLYADNVDALKTQRTVGGGSALGCGSAEELWRLPSPGRSLQENADYCSENRAQRGSPNELWGTSSIRNLPSSSQKSSLEDHGKPAPFGEELAQGRDLESLPLAQKDDLCRGLAPSGRLWRAESWDSLGSAASVASGLSLAERVEKNRAVLQEMLSLSRQNRSPLEPHRYAKEALMLAKDGAAQELLVNDLDWDSGISLQDSEGYRAFVPTEELELSPRHEQAKQLLQRARMKARTSPLRASHDILPAVPQAKRAAIGENVSEERNSSLKDTLVLKEGQVTKPTGNEVEALSKGDQLPAAPRLAGKNSGDGVLGPVQRGHVHPPPSAQGQPSAPSIPGNRGTLENSAPAPQPANNVSQPRPATGISQQQAKQGAPCYNLLARVPAPPPTRKASSPVPYRKAILTGSYKLTGHKTGCLDQTSDLVTRPTSPPSKCGSVPEEQKSQHSPKVLSKSRLLALSTNNCNNTWAQRQHDGQAASVALSHREQAVSVQKLPASLGDSKGPSSAAAPSAAPSAISSVGITLSQAAEDTEPTQSGRLSRGEAPVSGSQQAKPFAEGSKLLDAHPEPKKPSASAASRKGGGSSTSGLKKFFCTLSQSTKQKLGRFRCYSMDQIPTEAPSLAPPPEAKADAADCSDLKKAPSLQSLRLVSPFCQLRKASSVQNLNSLLGKTDRSSFYLEGKPGESKAADRKAGAPPRRSLSVEDIGAPDLVRTVGRVVEVFPDGTSQLELQRPPQGTFGFRVSSGNGRPDTGIYVQEMADTSTTKLYAGLLGVGDEILEVNGAKVTRLGLAHISELLLCADTLSIRVLKQRPTKR